MSDWFDNTGVQPVANKVKVDFITYSGNYSYGWPAHEVNWNVNIDKPAGISVRKWRTEVFVNEEKK